MQQFAYLVYILGTSTKNTEKLQALQQYFATASDEDKVWVIAIFSGRRPKRIVSSTLLQQWCIELTQLPQWLFTECYDTVGDLAETIGLLLPKQNILIDKILVKPTLSAVLKTFIQLADADDLTKKNYIINYWQQADIDELFVFNKLITGGFRIGVSQKTMVNALAKILALEPSTIAHKISGNWNAATTNFKDLLAETTTNIDYSKPYPFYLANAIDNTVDVLGNEKDWQAEWKWDGIRGQIIKRNNQLFVWSRGEELITDKFPEYNMLAAILPNGVVLDGEIICLNHTVEETTKQRLPMPFAVLQTRIGRKNITKKNLEEAPVGFIAYDIMEYNGVDCREQSQQERRLLLTQLINALPKTNVPIIQLSESIQFNSWADLAELRLQARAIGSEGLMLKRKTSTYKVGRKVGDWWKWKLEPLVIDAVLIYAQKGHGRRSNLYTDYTFAVQDGDKLVTFTKAYSGLTDKEFAEVDAFVKSNSLEKFGPVRTVKPQLVFEIAFEGIAASNRHKSGVALRFPRISRWRKDKKLEDINTVEDLKKLLVMYQK